MFTALKKTFGRRPATARKAAGFRPALEALEGRDVPSVAGYSSAGCKDFFVDHGYLKERDQYGNVRVLASSVSQVSVLESDYNPSGSARADILGLDGTLRQWDDILGWKSIATGVKQVSAGWNGNSAVLFGNGYLSLYNTDTNTWTGIASGIASASLGRDSIWGAPTIGLVTTGAPLYGVGTSSVGGYAYEWRAAGGFEVLGSGVKQVSAGVGGYCVVLYANGSVYGHQDDAYSAYGAYGGYGTWTYVASGIASVSCGYEWETDNTSVALVDFSGNAFVTTPSSGTLKFLGSGVVEADASGSSQTYLCYANSGIDRCSTAYFWARPITTTTMVYGVSYRDWMG